MMKRIFDTAICLILGFLLSAHVSAGTLYTVDENAPQSLYSIDPATGIATLIGETDPSEPQDLFPSFSGGAYDSLNDKLFFTTFWSYTADDEVLVEIDPVSGLATAIGPHVDSDNVFATAYDSLNDILYGFDFNKNKSLVTINRVTGETTPIGPVGGATDVRIDGMAYDRATDTLYGVNSDTLYTLNRATGLGTAVGDHSVGVESSRGLAIDPDTGIMYMTVRFGGLWTIDKDTGAASLVAETGIRDPGSLAVIPDRPTLNAADLVAGRDAMPAGTVTVTDNGGTLTVTFNAADPWLIFEAHAAMGLIDGDDCDVPQNKKGNPKVGQFEGYAFGGLPGSNSLPVNLVDMFGDEITVCIAAHAVVYDSSLVGDDPENTTGCNLNPDEDDDVSHEEALLCSEEGVWGDGYEFDGKNWAMWFEFTRGEIEGVCFEAKPNTLGFPSAYWDSSAETLTFFDASQCAGSETSSTSAVEAGSAEEAAPLLDCELNDTFSINENYNPATPLIFVCD